MISNLAQIHPKAQLGNNVTVEGFTTIYEDVVIGDGTHIGPNVTIYPGARIGKNCQIFPGAVISAVPQDLKFKGEYTTTEIGDNTVIRECVTIHRGTEDMMKTTVGNNCLLMGYVHVAHDCQIGNNCILANYTGLSGHNILEDYVILEGKVGTQQFIRIGENSFVAGGTLVRKNVPPFIRAAREPITFAGVNAIGLRRRGWSDAEIKIVEDAYRQLFVMNNTISAGVAAIESEVEDGDIKNKILNFIKMSDRGIIKGPM
ncbi:acyl-ACP--UDP-N-acetylglucosamine O-acyltransferase [Paracrocinitomix mangrovi]|uniref:acyl-ACP--UDP-N-acetylglucosamine O-acyltransferase n=1 Tax=Paracrocinitomix mangrovi TaxID=2862509 RepID=UPI001C8ECA82|nr:acyl-ACP--UDP-N-acetylglucosamine O-acyltransferase [Paracrocinitomix mangrovi]UKN01545.1 acyl-ACP--UDP-N-acetylglucosamine O-acyltransferase [Paracrocinitomix mangrovi]